MYIITQAPAAASFTVNTGAATQAFLVAAGEPGAGTQVNVSAPGSNRLNGQPFVVRAAGYLALPAGTNTAAATPLQVMLFASNTASFSVASGNVICSLTAVVAFTYAAAVTGYLPFNISAQFLGGPGGTLGSYNLGGQTTDPNGVNLVTIPVLSTTGVSSFNPLTEPAVQITVGLKTAAANLLTNAVANLTSLILEA